MRGLPDNFIVANEYYTPFTPQELEERYDDFIENDAGNGKFIETNWGRIFENGAVWRFKEGRFRGPIPENSADWFTHRRKYVRAKKAELDRLKAAYTRRFEELRNRIKHASYYGGVLPDSIEAEIEDVKKMKPTIDRKEREFRQLTRPERELEWEVKEYEEAVAIAREDRGAELLRKLEANPFAPNAEDREDAKKRRLDQMTEVTVRGIDDVA